ncbi:hypothetical protein GQ600_9570 [Phytophthora cactorum]|nr:hypothetical protein GQ600_9570 [Phytophthora cactorum]
MLLQGEKLPVLFIGKGSPNGKIAEEEVPLYPKGSRWGRSLVLLFDLFDERSVVSWSAASSCSTTSRTANRLSAAFSNRELVQRAVCCRGRKILRQIVVILNELKELHIAVDHAKCGAPARRLFYRSLGTACPEESRHGLAQRGLGRVLGPGAPWREVGSVADRLARSTQRPPGSAPSCATSHPASNQSGLTVPIS